MTLREQAERAEYEEWRNKKNRDDYKEFQQAKDKEEMFKRYKEWKQEERKFAGMIKEPDEIEKANPDELIPKKHAAAEVVRVLIKFKRIVVYGLFGTWGALLATFASSFIAVVVVLIATGLIAFEFIKSTKEIERLKRDYGI